MAGLFTSLSNASSALQTHGKMVELAGKNIANLNNPKYARQRVSIGTIGTSTPGTAIQGGALVTTGIEQLRNAFVDKQLLNEISYSASLETQDLRLRQLLSDLGESIDRVNDPAFLSCTRRPSRFERPCVQPSVDVVKNSLLVQRAI